MNAVWKPGKKSSG